jgi:hypothetical protein
VNDLSNRLLNYLNTICSGYTNDGRIITAWTVPSSDGVNLSRKFVDETTLSRVNELVKKTLNPIGIFLEYKSDGRDNALSSLYVGKKAITVIMSSVGYKEAIPWNFVLEEYKNLEASLDIVGKLSQKEL